LFHQYICHAYEAINYDLCSKYGHLVKVGRGQHFILTDHYPELSKQYTSFNSNLVPVILSSNEKEGIPPDLIPLLDVCVEIPQQGVVRSLNVHVTGALFVWEYMRQQVLK